MGAAVTTILSRKCGRPLSLGEIDEEVQKFTRALRKAGTPINTAVVLPAAKEIVVSKDRTLQSQHGVQVKLTKGWTASLMQRMKSVKRWGSTQMKTALTEEKFKEVKAKFLARVRKVAHQHHVMLNSSSTGTRLV